MGLKIENRGTAGGFSLKKITNNGNFSVVILPSPSISITPSITPSITFTPTITPSATPSNTITPSISTTPTVTFTPSISTTPTVTFTPSISTTPSITPSITIAQVTQTPTLTVTPSISRTPSITPSISRTPSITPSISRTITPTPSITPTITATPTITRTITPTPSITPSITPSTSALGTRLYSNFDAYIVGGVRQASTGDLIRTNISSARRLIVTETISIRGFVLVRIPPDNWSTTSGYGFQPTLSVVSGTGATIDGGSSSKTFFSQVTILNPSNTAERTGGTSQYDIYRLTPSDASTTTLTAGQYTLSVLGTAANMDIATLTTATFPIDTSKTIYPSGSTTHFAMEVF